MLLFWKLVDETQNIKKNLACKFLSVRVNFKETFQYETPCSSNGVKPDPAIIEDLFDSFEMIDGFSSASGILETLKLDKLKVCPCL